MITGNFGFILKITEDQFAKKYLGFLVYYKAEASLV